MWITNGFIKRNLKHGLAQKFANKFEEVNGIIIIQS